VIAMDIWIRSIAIGLCVGLLVAVIVRVAKRRSWTPSREYGAIFFAAASVTLLFAFLWPGPN